MSNETKQTAVEWYIIKRDEIEMKIRLMQISPSEYEQELIKAEEQAKEMEKEQMRLDIEKKWVQYRIITNNEDAWSFKEWLIKQTYGGNK